MLKLFEVKKNKIQRIGLFIYTLLFVILTTIPFVCWKIPWELYLLILLPCNLIMIFIYLYHETWCLEFYSDRICKRIFYITVRTYYYNVIHAAYTFRGLLVIKFTNNKLYIPVECDNLSKAIRMIERYHRIRY